MSFRGNCEREEEDKEKRKRKDNRATPQKANKSSRFLNLKTDPPASHPPPLLSLPPASFRLRRVFVLDIAVESLRVLLRENLRVRGRVLLRLSGIFVELEKYGCEVSVVLRVDVGEALLEGRGLGGGGLGLRLLGRGRFSVGEGFGAGGEVAEGECGAAGSFGLTEVEGGLGENGVEIVGQHYWAGVEDERRKTRRRKEFIGEHTEASPENGGKTN